jgi:hypothetical protein
MRIRFLLLIALGTVSFSLLTALAANSEDSQDTKSEEAVAEASEKPAPASDNPSLIDTPSVEELDESLPQGGSLTGKDLYDRFLKNRRKLESAYQESHSVSLDPAGNEQKVNFWLRWRDYRDENDEPVGDIESKTLLKLTGPFEMRHTGYLYVHHDERKDEQFMYSPARGRTARMSLEGQTIAGTDFSFDDFLLTVDDVEDGHYKRLPDEEIDGTPVYVVDAVMSSSSRASYTRSMLWLEKAHYVPVKARYWDSVGVMAKELTAPHDKIKEFDGAWVSTVSTMKNLLEETETVMYIDRLNPKAELSDYDFSLSQLEFKP